MKSFRKSLIVAAATGILTMVAYMTGCVTVPVPGPGGMQFNTDRPGSDLSSFTMAPGAGPAACRSACNSNAACRAWTYVKPGYQHPSRPRCWLKHSVPMAVSKPCCTSGVK